MKEKRLQDIRRYILERKHISNKELCDAFGISIETVRRDISLLEKEGLIRKVYGGARLVENTTSSVLIEKWDDRLHRNEMLRDKMAKKAVSLIPDKSTIFVDSGTSVFRTIPYLKEKREATILTNSLRVAMELGGCKNLTVYFIGGMISPDMLVSTGFFATELLAYFYNIDYAITSCDGFSPENGTSEYLIEVSMLKKVIMEKVDHIIALIDHTKFNKNSSCLCCKTESLEVLVTDISPSREDRNIIQNKGVQLEVIEDSEPISE